MIMKSPLRCAASTVTTTRPNDDAIGAGFQGRLAILSDALLALKVERKRPILSQIPLPIICLVNKSSSGRTEILSNGPGPSATIEVLQIAVLVR